MDIHELPSGTLANEDVLAVDNGANTRKLNFKNIVNSLITEADLTDNPVAFTSGDAASPTAWTNVSVITTGSTLATLFNRISTMIKNVRWLYSKLGTTDISSIGNGTVTGALSTLNGKTSKTYSGTPNNVIVTSYKANKIVEVTVVQETASSWTRGQYITLATIDAEYRPSRNIPMVFYDNSATVTSDAICGVGQVGATGIVRVWLFTNITRNSSIRGTVTYILG